MRKRRPLRRSGVIDLIAFLAVLATGIALVALRTDAATIAAAAGGLSTLYTAWARSIGGPYQPSIERPVEEPEAQVVAGQPGLSTHHDPRQDELETSPSR
jgi:hypothetical protein